MHHETHCSIYIILEGVIVYISTKYHGCYNQQLWVISLVSHDFLAAVSCECQYISELLKIKLHLSTCFGHFSLAFSPLSSLDHWQNAAIIELYYQYSWCSVSVMSLSLSSSIFTSCIVQSAPAMVTRVVEEALVLITKDVSLRWELT